MKRTGKCHLKPATLLSEINSFAVHFTQGRRESVILSKHQLTKETDRSLSTNFDCQMTLD